MKKSSRVKRIRSRNSDNQFNLLCLRGYKACKRGIKRVMSKEVRWNLKAEWH